MTADEARKQLGDRELAYWMPMWSALLKLCPEAEDWEGLATCLTGMGFVYVSAGLVRELEATGAMEAEMLASAALAEQEQAAMGEWEAHRYSEGGE